MSLVYTTANFPLVALLPSVSYLQGTTTVNTNPGGGDAFITEFDITNVLQGVQENSSDTEFTIGLFPNPANNGSLNLVLHSVKNENLKIRIYDSMGRTVYIENRYLVKEEYSPVDLSSYSNGFYFIQIENESGKIRTEKFVINK